MIDIVLASNNEHKVREIQQILGIGKYRVLSLAQLNIDSNPEENGKTFRENALIKAKDARMFTDKIVIADDSGLIVPSLDNQPGVYSKRYAGENATDTDNNNLLIKKLSSSDEEKRKAMFVCCICMLKDEEIFFAEGICEGKIIMVPEGDNGFGYDPIFYVEKYHKTFAQLTAQEKNSISHRGKAVIELKKLLEEVLT